MKKYPTQTEAIIPEGILRSTLFLIQDQRTDFTIHPDLDQRKNENNSNRLYLPGLRTEDCARERSGTHSFGCELFLACWPHITTVKRRGQWTFFFSFTSSRNPLGQATSAFKYMTYCIHKFLWKWRCVWRGGSHWVIVRRLVEFTSPWSILSRHCPHSDANWLPSSLSIPLYEE